MKRKYIIEYYKSKKDSLWYWRLLAPNKRVQADGAEGYESKSNVLRALKRNKVINLEFVEFKEVEK